MIKVLPKWTKTPPDVQRVDVTSSSGLWSTLSPFLLGPVMLYDGMWSKNMENAWQYAKLYAPEHTGGFDTDGYMSAYWKWAKEGWDNPRAVRYPMGKGRKPLFSLWAGRKLDYIEARKMIYMPLYSQAVRFYATKALNELRTMQTSGAIAILDYDAYDHRSMGYSWDDVINDPDRKMGHGFVLAMMLEGVI